MYTTKTTRNIATGRRDLRAYNNQMNLLRDRAVRVGVHITEHLYNFLSCWSWKVRLIVHALDQLRCLVPFDDPVAIRVILSEQSVDSMLDVCTERN